MEFPAATPARPERMHAWLHPTEQGPLERSGQRAQHRDDAEVEERAPRPAARPAARPFPRPRQQLEPGQQRARTATRGRAKRSHSQNTPVEVAQPHVGVCVKLAVAFHDFAFGNSNGRLAEPGRSGTDFGVVGDGADAEQDVVGERLAAGDHDIIAEVGVFPQADRGERDRPLVDSWAGQINAVGEERFAADSTSSGMVSIRVLISQPRPIFMPASAATCQSSVPVSQTIGRLDQPRLEPNADVRQAPSADRPLRERVPAPAWRSIWKNNVSGMVDDHESYRQQEAAQIPRRIQRANRRRLGIHAEEQRRSRASTSAGKATKARGQCAPGTERCRTSAAKAAVSQPASGGAFGVGPAAWRGCRPSIRRGGMRLPRAGRQRREIRFALDVGIARDAGADVERAAGFQGDRTDQICAVFEFDQLQRRVLAQGDVIADVEQVPTALQQIHAAMDVDALADARPRARRTMC